MAVAVNASWIIIFIVGGGLISRSMRDEIVVMDLKGGSYYNFDQLLLPLILPRGF